MVSSLLRSANSSVNASSDLNRFGSRKFNSVQSSARLFCNGVPVSRRRNDVFSCLSPMNNLDLRFLSLWPSSTIIARQFRREKKDRSETAYSYVVRITFV